MYYIQRLVKIQGVCWNVHNTAQCSAFNVEVMIDLGTGQLVHPVTPPHSLPSTHPTLLSLLHITNTVSERQLESYTIPPQEADRQSYLIMDNQQTNKQTTPSRQGICT